MEFNETFTDSLYYIFQPSFLDFAQNQNGEVGVLRLLTIFSSFLLGGGKMPLLLKQLYHK